MSEVVPTRYICACVRVCVPAGKLRIVQVR